jgi:hypothetical protein
VRRYGVRLGAMTHREHLAQADRFIAECKDRIERQREIIASAMKTVSRLFFLCRRYERWRKTCVPSRNAVS